MNTTTTAASRSSQISPMVDTSSSSDVVSLRNFVVEEDRANLGSDLWKSVDKSAFILAQREAIESYNLAKALRLSKESAAKEERMRLAQAEEAAKSLARSWNVDGLQPALLKNSSTTAALSSSPPRSSTRHQSTSSSSSRPNLRRDPPTVDNLSNNPSSSSSTKVSSASSAPAAAVPESSSSQQKRRKASISVSSQSQSHSQNQPQYSYSTSNYSYPYQPPNQSNTQPNNHPQVHSSSTSTGTSQASIHAQQQLEGRKPSSASSRDIQAGHILNPKESSPRTQSPSSSASAQAAAAEREKEREKGKEKERSRSNSSSHSSSSSRRRSSSSAAHGPQVQPQMQVPPQAQSQQQSQAQAQQQEGPRDLFAPVRFNCTKCGNLISSVVLSQPSLALTSPDPFSHPFASALHIICNNPSCGTVHCRGCLEVVKCRDVEHPSSSSSADSQALVPISSSISNSPPASNSTSPIRPAFTFSKSQQHIQTQNQAHSQRACAGGPGCALWSCCPAVRVIAIWEALRAFDALFGAEAGFQVTNQQWKAGQPQSQGQGEVGRQYREAYVRTVISKADKSMRRYEDGFARVLKVVGSWLQVPTDPSAQFSRDTGSSRRQSTILDPEQIHGQNQSPDTLFLNLARLFLDSHLLEVVHTFLSNRNVKDWMSHAETYLDVLDVVGKMMDCGLGFLLKEVSGVNPVPSSSALTAAASSSGFYNPFSAVTPSLSTSPSQSPPLVPLLLSPTALSGSTPTLYDLISQLESYRGELKRFLTKVSFGVTVDKASKLHEAITYLVLQLVVGEF